MQKELSLGRVQRTNVTFGCDPEFFLATRKRGAIRGAERVIPKEGLKNSAFSYLKVVVLDGVQAEFHTRPHSCRELLGNELHLCFWRLRKHLLENPEFAPSFKSVAKISKRELNSLSDDAKKFGCAPSKNTYGVETKINVDPAVYTTRSAGGHIHIGRTAGHSGKALAKPEILVPVLDMLLGNTCVLLDRDPNMEERRKIYGRAGEYRTPNYGIEYRVLSNFWLRSYPLMSFVMSLARFSVGVVAMGEKYYETLLSLVPSEDIQRAINKNDFELAMKNFNKIIPFFTATTTQGLIVSNTYPLTELGIPLFKYVVAKGVDYWWGHNIVDHWADLVDCVEHLSGWGTFLRKTVRAAYKGEIK